MIAALALAAASEPVNAGRGAVVLAAVLIVAVLMLVAPRSKK